METLTGPWQVRLCLESERHALRTARKLVKAAASIEHASEAAADDVELAVGEILANAYVHAYGGGAGPIEVEMGFDGDALTIVVHDDGEPIADKLAVPTQLSREAGGRGLYLTGRVMDEVEIVHPDREKRGTAVRMKKYLAARS